VDRIKIWGVLTTMPKTHIVGAGMAGLAAAVKLSEAGHLVTLYEAASHAGGRCRSFHDTALDCVIDNGNHLLLSGNTAVFKFLKTIGAEHTLVGPKEAIFKFIDVRDGKRWSVRPNMGRIPWWIFCADRRVPRSSWVDYLSALKLFYASPNKTLTEILSPSGRLFERYWEPLAVSVLNTPANQAAASLLWPVFAETFGRGGYASRPMIARKGLSDSFVDPAITLLTKHKAKIKFGSRLKRIEKSAGMKHIKSLVFADQKVSIPKNEAVILALPASITGSLMTEVKFPAVHNPIVNVHFKLNLHQPPDSPVNFIGIIGGTAEWLFVRGDIVSITISAANKHVSKSAEEIINLTWSDVASALGLDVNTPKQARVVKEKRATFAQTPESLKLRAKTNTDISNLKLAGDWTDTGIPATIEGAIRSGYAAADSILNN